MFLYFGPLIVERATAEADGVAAHVPDREQHAGAHRVLQLVRLVHEREPGVDDVLARELLLLQLAAQYVEAVGRPSERELAGDVAVETAAAEIPARVAGVGRVEQPAMVEVDRSLHGRVQSLAALAVFGERGVVVAQRDVGARGEALDGLDEVEVFDLPQERDRVAALLAAEAVPNLHLGIHRERRRLLGVERTQAREPTSDTLQRHMLGDQRDDVGCFPNPLHVLVEDSHPGADYESGQTPRGRSSGRQPRSSTPSPSAYRSVIPLT